MFLLGFSHPGKNIVAFNYVLEQMPAHVRAQIVCVFRAIESGWIIVIAFCYQYVDRSYKTLSYISLGMIIVTIVLCTIYLYESPKYYHTARKYNECRESLKKMAEYNNVTDYDSDFIFIEESTEVQGLTQGLTAIVNNSTESRKISSKSSPIWKTENTTQASE